jgi:hypothetical protein
VVTGACVGDERSHPIPEPASVIDSVGEARRRVFAAWLAAQQGAGSFGGEMHDEDRPPEPPAGDGGPEHREAV